MIAPGLIDRPPASISDTGDTGPLVDENGMPLPVHRGRQTYFFHPDGPGFVRLTVMDARGASDSVMVRLQ